MKSNFKYISYCISISILFLVVTVSCNITEKITTNSTVFSKENLIPWSIVSFDVKERTPKQRIQMLKDLGYSQYAYGNRPKHQSTMLAELKLAKENNIKINAVWLYINLGKDKVGQLKPHSEAIFKTLEKSGLKTQIWIGFQSQYFEKLTDEQSLLEAVAMVKYLSERAEKLDCKIALYNHGGWYGNPKNQLRIIKKLPKQEIGIVYNFHHAHHNLENYASDIKKMLPYLWCVNLNGMKKDGPKIITIGKGNLEKKMINQLLEIGYKGPFGILGHVKGGDAKVILEQNFAGLELLFSEK